MTCRVILMQLLRSSQKGIEDRLTHLDAYAKIFEELIRTQLTDISELIALRETLRKVTLEKDPLSQVGKEIMTSWKEARTALVDVFELRNPFAGTNLDPYESIATAPDGTLAFGIQG
jgi:hypothetical protein